MSEQIDFIETASGEPVATCGKCAALIPRNETANHEIWHDGLADRVRSAIEDKLARS